MVVVDLDGRIEGKWKPSSDTPTHVELYVPFPGSAGIVRVAQGVQAMGATGQAAYGEIPCTRPMTPEEIAGEYEKETGKVIIETFAGKEPRGYPGCAGRRPRPVAWGTDAEQGGVRDAVVLEEVSGENPIDVQLTRPQTQQQELLNQRSSRQSFAESSTGLICLTDREKRGNGAAPSERLHFPVLGA